MYVPAMRRFSVFLSFGLLLFGCSAASRQVRSKKGSVSDREVSYRERVLLSLTEGDGGHSLASTTYVSFDIHSKKAAEKATHAIYAPYFAPLEGAIEARLDGEKLSSKQIVEVTPQARSVFLLGGKVYLLKFKHVEVGQTVSWRYRQRYKAVEWLGMFSVPNRDRVERFTLEIEHPAAVSVDLKQFFPRRRFDARVEQTATRTRVTLANLPHALPLESFRHNDVHAWLWPRLRKGERWLTPVTAGGFARWYQGLFGRFKPLSAPQRAEVDRLLAGAASREEKMRRVYDWTRKNVRYIADERGLGAVVPRDPPTVIRRRYGDCKDMANVIVAMARHAGIEAEPVLVSAKDAPELDGVNPEMFNHMIASYLEGERRVFLDPTCWPCEFGNLPEGDVGRVGLVLDGEGSRRSVIPAPPQKPSIELEVTASASDLEHGKASIVLRNKSLWKAKEIQRGPPKKHQTELSKLIGMNLYGLLLRDLRFKAVAEDHAVLEARADLTKLVVRSSRRLYLPKVVFRTQFGQLLERREDSYPIHLAWRDHMSLRITLSAAGYRVKAAKPLRLGSEEMIHYSAELDGGGDAAFRASYYFRQRSKRFAGAARGELLAFYDQYLKDRRQMFALEKVSQ
jgi:transglutaminase-like putative cysteine protease